MQRIKRTHLAYNIRRVQTQDSLKDNILYIPICSKDDNGARNGSWIASRDSHFVSSEGDISDSFSTSSSQRIEADLTFNIEAEVIPFRLRRG